MTITFFLLLSPGTSRQYFSSRIFGIVRTVNQTVLIYINKQNMILNQAIRACDGDGNYLIGARSKRREKEIETVRVDREGRLDCSYTVTWPFCAMKEIHAV